MAASEDQNTLARFYNNKQFSDVIVKFGENELYAHKVILAERSAYFARAFLGQFAVASSSTIDLGDEDDPEMVREMIRSMYIPDHTLRYSEFPPYEKSLASLLDLFILADKYDHQRLRRKIFYTFQARLSNDYSRNKDEFIESIIARVCGPTAIQFADKDLQRSVSRHCNIHFADLLQDRRFVEQYTEGTLFDSKFALAFNLHVGKSALESQGIVTTLVRDFGSKIAQSPSVPCKSPEFFNNQSLSDVMITYGRGQTMFAHKVILATPPSPSHFHRILEDSPSINCIALGSQDEPRLIEALIHDLYDLKHDPEPEDWTAFSADMYLIAKKYGLDTIANIYLEHFIEEIYEDMTTSEYALQVAKFCGPYAPACYVETELSERMFAGILEETRLLLDDNRTFCKMLEDGTLFNHKFAGRFTMMTVELWRDAEPRIENTVYQQIRRLLRYTNTTRSRMLDYSMLSNTFLSMKPHSLLFQSCSLTLGIFSSSNNDTKGSLSIPTCTLPSIPTNRPYAHRYPCHCNHSALSFSIIELVPSNS